MTMRVAVVQHDIEWEDPKATFARVEPWIAAAAGAGARLVVLAEMFSTGFSMATERTVEPVDGPSVGFLSEQAARHGLWLCGSVPEQADDAALPSNTFVLAAPDGDLTRYRKLHPFSYAGEHEHFAPGDGIVTVDVEGVRVTPFVCYDLRFADVFWSAATATDCYVVVANWPEARRHHWTTLLQARAIENQAYVVGCNRVGEGGGLRYSGDSLVVDPLGTVLAAGAGSETLLLADVDPGVVARTRARLPFLQDRRG